MVWQNSRQSYCQSDCKTVGNPSASRIAMHWRILLPVGLQYSRQTTASWTILISCHINFRMINVSVRNFECALQQLATSAGLVIKILLPDKNPTGHQDPIHHYFPVCWSSPPGPQETRINISSLIVKTKLNFNLNSTRV